MRARWRLWVLRRRRDHTAWQLQFRWDDNQLQQVYKNRCDAVALAESYPPTRDGSR